MEILSEIFGPIILFIFTAVFRLIFIFTWLGVASSLASKLNNRNTWLAGDFKAGTGDDNGIMILTFFIAVSSYHLIKFLIEQWLSPFTVCEAGLFLRNFFFFSCF